MESNDPINLPSDIFNPQVIKEIAHVLTDFKHQRQMRPGDISIDSVFAYWLYCHSYIDQAIFVWKQIATNPLVDVNPLVHVHLGDAFYTQGLLDDATRSYNQAIKLNKYCTEAYLGLAQLAAERGSFEMAHNLCGVPEAWDPRSTNIQICQIHILFREYRMALGLKWPEHVSLKQTLIAKTRLIHRIDYIQDIRNHFGLDLFTSGQIQEARSCFLLNGVIDFKWKIKALFLVHTKDNKDILDFCNLALSLDFMNIDALYNKSNFLTHQGEWHDSISCLMNIRTISPKFPGVCYMLATVYSQASDYLTDKPKFKDIEELYLKELQINSTNLLVIYCLGMTYFRTQQYANSIARLETIPKTRQICSIILMSKLKLGQIDEAISYATESLEIYPTNLDLLIGLADAQSQKGNYEHAQTILMRAINQHGRDPILLSHLGVLHFNFHRFQEAEAIFLEILRQTGIDQQTNYVNLILLYSSQNRWHDLHLICCSALKQHKTDPTYYFFDARYSVHMNDWHSAKTLLLKAKSLLDSKLTNKTPDDKNMLERTIDLINKCEENMTYTEMDKRLN